MLRQRTATVEFTAVMLADVSTELEYRYGMWLATHSTLTGHTRVQPVKCKSQRFEALR
jgi:hypothetical protein